MAYSVSFSFSVLPPVGGRGRSGSNLLLILGHRRIVSFFVRICRFSVNTFSPHTPHPSFAGGMAMGFQRRFIPVPFGQAFLSSVIFLGVPGRLGNLAVQRCGSGFGGAASSTRVL